MNDSKTLIVTIHRLALEGVDALMKATGARVAELREAQRKALEGQEHFDQIWQHRRDAKDKKFKVTKLSEGVFRVTGKQIERMVIQTDWENEEAVIYLQHKFARMGVDDALEKAGCRAGDEVRICQRAFDFEGAEDFSEYEELEDAGKDVAVEAIDVADAADEGVEVVDAADAEDDAETSEGE